MLASENCWMTEQWTDHTSTNVYKINIVKEIMSQQNRVDKRHLLIFFFASLTNCWECETTCNDYKLWQYWLNRTIKSKRKVKERWDTVQCTGIENVTSILKARIYKTKLLIWEWEIWPNLAEILVDTETPGGSFIKMMIWQNYPEANPSNVFEVITNLSLDRLTESNN